MKNIDTVNDFVIKHVNFYKLKKNIKKHEGKFDYHEFFF